MSDISDQIMYQLEIVSHCKTISMCKLPDAVNSSTGITEDS